MNKENEMKSKLGQINSIGLLVSFLLMALLFWLITMEVTPFYKEMIDGFGTEVPRVTYYLRNDTFFWPLYILVIVAIIKEPLITSKLLSCIINWLFIWTIPIYVYFFLLAVYGPIFALMKAVN